MNSPGFKQDSPIYAALKERSLAAPAAPGVYLWRDEENRVIYVGKARVLRNRLKSYFAGTKDPKTRALVHHARSIETIIVANEYEALLLENTLIKQHTPKYNINLKDGKTYPVIRITAEPFPRVFKTRHIITDSSQYFGPFPQIHAVDTLLAGIDKLFPLRKCRIFRKRESPCMYYHINRCLAPCCGTISQEAYQVHIQRVRRLLADQGSMESVVMDLSVQMHREAKALRFERAVLFRDTIKAIEDLKGQHPTLVDRDPEARDYIAWAGEGVICTFTVFSLREGKMIGRDLFRTRSAATEGESLETFAAAYYTPERPPPAQIYVRAWTEADEGDFTALTRWFEEHFGYAPGIRSLDEKASALGSDRRHRAVLAMAQQNAQEDLRLRLKERGAGPALDELVQALGLTRKPKRNEGFDIAQLQGKHPVASLVTFTQGRPDRKNYRYFKLRTVVGVVDDFAAMREAVGRRYSRLLQEGKEPPDLVLVDGGIGQVNAAKGVLDALGLDCDVVGLAKRDEELWLPQKAEPIRLSKRSEGLKVLQFVRDETHRFATSLNQRLRSQDLSFPILESIDGIGPKRAARIMKTYGHIAAIAQVDPRSMAEACKISETLARTVRAAATLALEDQQAAQERLTQRELPE
ncbi:MAG: excinuclease ABC subunit UvrC [Spirochaetaceae bacterium]|jgi:excinuclease ABC subunit C|nr:excinuclease ABC subunit UvrC [Spirochaetaceae bacterium]